MLYWFTRSNAATWCTSTPKDTAMFQAQSRATPLLPTNPRYYRLPQIQRTAFSAVQPTTKTAGRFSIPHIAVRCGPHQGQHPSVKEAGPVISSLDLHLQLQWDHTANAHLGNIVIRRRSNRKVWWTCDQCPDGYLHSWSAAVSARTTGNGCPQCSGRAVCKHNSLATKAPLVAAEWDYEANDSTPGGVVAQSTRLVQWRCQVCSYSWEATPHARVSKRKLGCAQCAAKQRTSKKIKHPTFAKCNHPLLAEWDHDRNADHGHFPDHVSLRSNMKIFWLCTKCPAGQQHSWSAMPLSRTGPAKSGCPFCTGHAACTCNSLPALHPDIAAEWDYSKNPGQPSDYPAYSRHLAWWSSPQRGSWQQTINSRTGRFAWLKRIQERQGSVGLKPGQEEE